jgi:hypothetical protein
MTTPRSILLAALAVFTLCGCTTVQVDPTRAASMTAAQLGIDSQAIVYQSPARFAATNMGTYYAKFQLGLYTQTRTNIVLFSYDAELKTFKQVLSRPIALFDQVSMESWGSFNRLKQLQLKAGETVIAVNFSNDSGAMAGYLEETEPAYKALLAAGVMNGAGYGRVMPQELKNFVIPIFIR